MSDVEKQVNEKESSQHQIITEVPIDPYAPPDGGLQAWLTVLGATLVGFSTFGVVNAFGAFSDFYKRDYLSNYDPTLISMIGAIQVFVLYFFGAFSGSLFDAFGPTYMIPISGAVTSFAFFMLSLTKPQQIYQQYLTQAILFNIGATFGFFPALSVITHWFKRKSAYALGCVLAGASAGGIVFPIMLDHLLPRVGFGWAVRAIAFIVLGCYIIATFTIKSRRPPKPLPPLSRIINLTAFRDPRYALFAAGAFFNILSVFNPFFYVGLYGVATHGESKITPYLLPIMNATSIFGRVLPAILADRVGRFNVICVSVLACSIIDFAVWYPTTGEAPIIVFAALYGFVSGPFFTLMPACVNQISPVEQVGGRIGMLFATLSFGALAGTPIGGVFIKTQTREHFQSLIIYTGVLGIVGAAFLVAARLKCDRRLFAKV
ncbi:MFS general substrate transporter [Artomyces pyxidatus]|uniref:MFS general substrate transporter n=1 Tax=Artomyces pyxidatus TaxID=48021 RepID=A0ACB8SK12_9AGAM|nr:MFS general substrate transporter [Artomyces pyxidatus]